MKATLGAVRHLQLPNLFAANSFTGPIARTVADKALLYRVLRGSDRMDPYGQAVPPTPVSIANLAGLRVSWMLRCGNPLLNTEVGAATTRAVRRTETAGAEVELIELDFVRMEPHFLAGSRRGVTRGAVNGPLP